MTTMNIILFFLPSFSSSSSFCSGASTFVLFMEGGEVGGGRADGLEPTSGGGGRITLAFEAAAGGDSWYFKKLFNLLILK